MSDKLLEKLFGVASPAPGKTYDFEAARAWTGRGGRGFGISWSARGHGFGEVYFEIGPNGQVHIDTECSSDEFVKELLLFMVDQATKDNDPKDWKTMNDYWQEGYAAEKGVENPYGEGAEKSASWWQQGYDARLKL